MSLLAATPPDARGVPYGEWIRRRQIERDPTTREELVDEILKLIEKGKVRFSFAHGSFWLDQDALYVGSRHWSLIQSDPGLRQRLAKYTTQTRERRRRR